MAKQMECKWYWCITVLILVYNCIENITADCLDLQYIKNLSAYSQLMNKYREAVLSVPSRCL